MTGPKIRIVEKIYVALLKTTFLFFFSALSITAQPDSSLLAFTDSLESALRTDYRFCTSDSSEISLNELVHWRQSIDSVLSSPRYPDIVRDFFRETGIPPVKARPCEIALWFRTTEKNTEEYRSLLDAAKISRLREHEDSLLLSKELSALKRNAYDFSNIPFGISKKAFLIVAKSLPSQKHSDEGNRLRYDSLTYGAITIRAAFHFSKNGLYKSYELEGDPCSLDSLDTKARRQLSYISEYFETNVSTPPDHIYRIGRFDIVPGRLAIYKLWNFSTTHAYFGLARSGRQFYAKVIVSNKVID